MIRFALSATAAILLCASASGAVEQRADRYEQAKLAKALRGLHPGKPQRCVRSDLVNDVRGFTGEILYVAGRDKLWRNRVVGNCGGLARGDVIVTRSLTRDYCEGDLVQTRSVTGGTFSGSCSLGKFVPYTRSR